MCERKGGGRSGEEGGGDSTRLDYPLPIAFLGAAEGVVSFFYFFLSFPPSPPPPLFLLNGWIVLYTKGRGKEENLAYRLLHSHLRTHTPWHTLAHTYTHPQKHVDT